MLHSLIVSIMLMVAPTEAPQITSADREAVKEAAAMIRSGDTQRGIFAMQALAERGIPQALFLMGEIHKDGIGKKEKEPNIPVATMYYRLASRLGHKAASLKLANILFFEGDGSEASHAEAIEAWQSLALEGNAEALYMLGMVYWNGDAGTERDPVRGYGLVWAASEKGYDPAIQSELSMKAMLNKEARETGMDYAKNIEDRGFSGGPLAMELVLDSVDGPVKTKPAKEKEPLKKPEDWREVWRLEVGFAMSELEVERLQKVLISTQREVIGELYSEIVESANRPGLYRLIFGPVESMHDAVSRCVDLKRAGHDCFARPPGES